MEKYFSHLILSHQCELFKPIKIPKRLPRESSATRQRDEPLLSAVFWCSSSRYQVDDVSRLSSFPGISNIILIIVIIFVGINTIMYYSATVVQMAGIGSASSAIWITAVIIMTNQRLFWLLSLLSLYYYHNYLFGSRHKLSSFCPLDHSCNYHWWLLQRLHLQSNLANHWNECHFTK